MHWLLVLALSGASAAFAQQAAVLAVRVTPELKLTAAGAGVQVKIRLARGASASVWREASCSAAAPATAYRVTRSGVWNVELSQLPGEGAKVCVLSSDGLLRADADAPR